MSESTIEDLADELGLDVRRRRWGGVMDASVGISEPRGRGYSVQVRTFHSSSNRTAETAAREFLENRIGLLRATSVKVT